MPVPLNVHHQLSSTIKKFRFEELESAVIPSFPEISWNEIRSNLVKNHESFTVTNALNFIEHAINEAKVTNKVLQERLATLELIEVSRHHSKRVWYAFEMKGTGNSEGGIIRNRDIRTRIVQNFLTYQMEMDVRLSTHDGITYISMKEKAKGKEAKRIMPVFFALFLWQHYFFCSKKNITKEFVDVLINSLNYTGATKIKLSGRNLPSLIKMLWLKKQGTVQSSALCDPPVLRVAEPIVKNTGIDFRQHVQRREYVTKCFGDEPPTLERLVLDAPDQSWKNKDVVSALPNEKMFISWEFRSHSITATLTQLAERRVFVTPLPCYVSDLMTTGKNELKLRET